MKNCCLRQENLGTQITKKQDGMSVEMKKKEKKGRKRANKESARTLLATSIKGQLAAI